MSLIPKIKLGQKTGRNKFHLPCMTHGTSEIGYVYPVYSRNLINNSHFSISSRQAIRLSPLFVPTMGDLSLRIYHRFIPHNKVWTPFDAFLDGKPFAFADGSTSVPKTIPSFCLGRTLRFLMGLYMTTPLDLTKLDTLRTSLTMSIYKKNSDPLQAPEPINIMELINGWGRHAVTIDGQEFTYYDGLDTYFENNRFSDYPYLYASGIPSFLSLPTADNSKNVAFYFRRYQDASGKNHFAINSIYSAANGNPNLLSIASDYEKNLSIPSYDNCDFMDCMTINDTEYYFCYNYNGAWKRLRSVCLGLGYAFNPFDTAFVSPIKLLAFYRAYWDLFGVNRDINFQDTNCAKISRVLSQTTEQFEFHTADGMPQNDMYNLFWEDLTNLTYTCPPDYFSSSVINTNQGVASYGDEVRVQSYDSSDTQSAIVKGTGLNRSPARPLPDGSDHISAIGIQMAMLLMRWVNRNTVVGSKIYDSLRARYGNIDVNDESSEGVQSIGEDTTSINIGAIFNQSDTNDGAPLGDFAGVGTGNGNSQRFGFDVNAFGSFISFVAVVPQMGYFQGMFRENQDGLGDNFEMFDSTFDAVGWQTLRYSELIADKAFKTSPSQVVGTNLGNFGYQPRYTHMKVPFNRCIGDLSLPHMQDSMLPYTLDRFFPQREASPVNNPMWLRSATRGDTNRIFQVTSPTDDHIIWQIYFDVEYDAPMKPLSTSYDTSLPDDNNSIEVSHE